MENYLKKQERNREFKRWIKEVEIYLDYMGHECDLWILERRLFIIGKEPTEAGEIILAVINPKFVY
jgi:hypothetical protein